jgi:hypothetical protein
MELNVPLKTNEHRSQHGRVNRDREAEQRNTLKQSKQHGSFSRFKTQRDYSPHILTTARCFQTAE